MHSTQVTSIQYIVHTHDVNKMYISVQWLEKLLYTCLPAYLVIHVLLQDMRYNPAVDTVNSKSSTLCTFRQDVP